MPNVITIKRQEVKINRTSRGDGIIRIDSEAADLMEKLLAEAGGMLTVKDLASSMIKYASNDTIIKADNEMEESE